jgi:hypothetical protein
MDDKMKNGDVKNGVKNRDVGKNSEKKIGKK